MLDLMNSLVEGGVLQPVDSYFAVALQKRAREEDPDLTLFFAFLMAHSREGHLCMRVDADYIIENQEIDESNHKEEDGNNEDVSLDDVANLFK